MKKLILLTMLVLPMLLVACGSDEDEPSYSDQTMVVGTVYKMSGGTTGWTSDNEYIASINSQGVVAVRVGETYIRNGSKSFKVTVTGMYNTFKEPCLQWGASKSVVKSFMSDYTIEDEYYDYIFYSGKLKELLTAYTFESEQLNGSSVFLLPATVSQEEIAGFMGERYILVASNEEGAYYTYITPDEKTIVVLAVVSEDSQPVYNVLYGNLDDITTSAALGKMNSIHGTPCRTGYMQLKDVISQTASVVR